MGRNRPEGRMTVKKLIIYAKCKGFVKSEMDLLSLYENIINIQNKKSKPTIFK